MALEDLLAALESDAREQVAQRLAAAAEEAERVTAEADVRASERRAEFVATRETGLRAAAELELVAARRDGRRLVLDARADMLHAVREAARARLPQVETDTRYRALLPTQLGQALRYLGEQAGVVRSSSWLAPILAAAALRRAAGGVRTEEAGVGGAGFVLVADDGSVKVDMTLDTFLDRMWPELSMEVAARVAGTSALVDATPGEGSAMDQGASQGEGGGAAGEGPAAGPGEV